MTRLSKTQTYSSEGPQCPYCEHTITADEGYFFDENRYVEETCGECKRKFTVSVYNSTTWTCAAIEPPAQPDPAKGK